MNLEFDMELQAKQKDSLVSFLNLTALNMGLNEFIIQIACCLLSKMRSQRKNHWLILMRVEIR